MQLRPFVGKWNEESCLEFWKEVSKRFVPATAKYRFNACTDANKQNVPALKIVFPKGSVNYGIVKKIKRGNVVIGVVRKNVLGYLPKESISISHVDGFCKRLRERVSRYSRRSGTFSKKKTPFYYHLLIFQTYNNFIEPYKEKKTPCMIEKITSKKWDWEDIITTYYQSS